MVGVNFCVQRGKQRLDMMVRLNEKGEQGSGETGRGESFRISHIEIGGLKNK